jgi:hypothetical protein
MWPFPMLRNYATDAMLTELFLSFARTKFSIVKNGTYELHLRGPMGEIKCWNANRWYAWAGQGAFTPTDAKEAAILWKDRMPSRAAVRTMRKAVEAVEVARFRAAERGEIVLNLDDYREVGYAVKRPAATVREEALRLVGASGPLGDPNVAPSGVEGRTK